MTNILYHNFFVSWNQLESQSGDSLQLWNSWDISQETEITKRKVIPLILSAESLLKSEYIRIKVSNIETLLKDNRDTFYMRRMTQDEKDLTLSIMCMNLDAFLQAITEAWDDAILLFPKYYEALVMEYQNKMFDVGIII